VSKSASTNVRFREAEAFHVAPRLSRNIVSPFLMRRPATPRRALKRKSEEQFGQIMVRLLAALAAVRVTPKLSIYG
jgi:hypothetical protein